MAALTITGIESFRFGMLAVAVEVVSVAEDARASASIFRRGGGVDPTSETSRMVAVDPVSV